MTIDFDNISREELEGRLLVGERYDRLSKEDKRMLEIYSDIERFRENNYPRILTAAFFVACVYFLGLICMILLKKSWSFSLDALALVFTALILVMFFGICGWDGYPNTAFGIAGIIDREERKKEKENGYWHAPSPSAIAAVMLFCAALMLLFSSHERLKSAAFLLFIACLLTLDFSAGRRGKYMPEAKRYMRWYDRHITDNGDFVWNDSERMKAEHGESDRYSETDSPMPKASPTNPAVQTAAQNTEIAELLRKNAETVDDAERSMAKVEENIARIFPKKSITYDHFIGTAAHSRTAIENIRNTAERFASLETEADEHGIGKITEKLRKLNEGAEDIRVKMKRMNFELAFMAVSGDMEEMQKSQKELDALVESLKYYDNQK